MKKLSINIEQNNKGPATIALSGELDHSNFDKLEESITHLFEEDKIYSIDFDFSSLDHISSVGVGVLISAISQAQAQGGIIRFKNLSFKIREIFNILGLPEEYFPEN